MKRVIVFTLLMLAIVFGQVSYAQDIDDYLAESAVNVIESDTSIDFYVRLAFDGEDVAGTVIPKTQVSYKTAFIRGVKLMWEGVYQDKPVKVHIEQVKTDYDGEKITVVFGAVNNREDFSCASKSSNKIWMYTGDGRSFYSLVYTYAEFLYTAGHEMGHIWGVSDIYSDDNELVRTIKSPMNERDTFYAQDIDYYFILHNRTWELENPLAYSADEEVIRYLEEQGKN